MPPLEVEGETLGQKHRNYNKIVKETKLDVIPEIDYNEADLDNLLKIDIACRNRDVNYVLKVLQCEDMLYVSRAIKRSTWIITDVEHADIINPKYLNEQLAPNMMSKAFNKLLLHVRLKLKDEQRVEEFFKYYNEIDTQKAIKWLPNCSTKFTEDNLHNFATSIPNHRIKRTCQKSFKCLSIYTKLTSNYYTPIALGGTRVYLKSHTSEYLDIVERFEDFEVAKFGSNATKLLIKKCNDRVNKKFNKYAPLLHVPTFAKMIKINDIKDFITKNYNKKEMRKSWFVQKKIKNFINRLPVDSRFEFVRDTFINSTKMQECVHERCELIWDNKIKCETCSAQDVHRWYVYAPFNIAFEELKKMINLEPKPTENVAMLCVLLKCAGDDMKNVYMVLKYYRENHINEPSKFKRKFVNHVVNSGITHRFDKGTWGYLNDLFSSLGVYKESENINQNYVKSIILYSVLNDKSVPDVIEKKFLFNTLKINQKYLSENEKEKVFFYLYQYLTSKIDLYDVENAGEFSELVKSLTNLLKLLVDWNKELQHFPSVLSKLKDAIQIRHKSEWTEDISPWYNIKKSWRKLLFRESIILSPTRESCINALKHDIELLQINKNELKSVYLKNINILKLILKKIRIYWPQRLANTYKDLFLNKLNENDVHKSSIVGLCILLPKKDLLNLVDKYVPRKFKNDITELDNAVSDICCLIASNIHLARPQIEPASILLYAERDLQFVLPTLNAIVYNMKLIETRELLDLLIAVPIPLKHITRLASSKLQHDELKKLFSSLWKTNKNRNIRAFIFNRTVDFVCKNNEPKALRDIWDLLSVFINDLTSIENKSVYTKLSKVEKVSPLVRSEFWAKSYKFFKALPSTVDVNEHIINLIVNRYGAIESADCDIVAKIVHGSLDKNLCSRHFEYNYVVIEYLRSTRNEAEHIERYNKILVPILERSLVLWDKQNNGVYNARKNLIELLLCLHSPFEISGSEKKLILPIYMFKDILKIFNNNLSIEENYVLITTIKLSLECLEIMEKMLITNEFSETWTKDKLYVETALQLGKNFVKYLKEDVANYSPRIFVLFSKVFINVIKIFNYEPMADINVLKAFLEFKDFVPGYMFLIETLATYEDDVVKNEILNDIITHPSQEIKRYCYSRKGIMWKDDLY